MKRSEAIISLSNKLQKSQNLLDGYKNGSIDLKCLCDNLATRAIDYCEGSLRMLPPKVELFNPDYPEFGLSTKYFNIWEPENEEE